MSFKYPFERQESTLQAKIIDYCKKEGWLPVKLMQTNLNGITDLLLLKNGTAIFWEIKRPGNKAEPLQLYRIDQLKKQGFKADVIDSWDKFLAEFEKINH